MLKENAERVKRLTTGEIWLFIIGRVLAAFGLGVWFALLWPASSARAIGTTALVVGLICLAAALPGLFRKGPS